MYVEEHPSSLKSVSVPVNRGILLSAPCMQLLFRQCLSEDLWPRVSLLSWLLSLFPTQLGPAKRRALVVIVWLWSDDQPCSFLRGSTSVRNDATSLNVNYCLFLEQSKFVRNRGQRLSTDHTTGCQRERPGSFGTDEWQMWLRTEVWTRWYYIWSFSLWQATALRCIPQVVLNNVGDKFHAGFLCVILLSVMKLMESVHGIWIN